MWSRSIIGTALTTTIFASGDRRCTRDAVTSRWSEWKAPWTWMTGGVRPAGGTASFPTGRCESIHHQPLHDEVCCAEIVTKEHEDSIVPE